MLLKITEFKMIELFFFFFLYTQKGMHVSRSKGDVALLVTSFL